MTNATCNNKLGVNTRETLPISATVLGKDIGDIAYLENVTLAVPVIIYPGKDGLEWVKIILEDGKIAYVARKFFNISIPVTPPPVIPPVVVDDKAIRLDEINKTEATMQTYYAFRRNEINNS